MRKHFYEVFILHSSIQLSFRSFSLCNIYTCIFIGKRKVGVWEPAFGKRNIQQKQASFIPVTENRITCQISFHDCAQPVRLDFAVVMRGWVQRKGVRKDHSSSMVIKQSLDISFTLQSVYTRYTFLHYFNRSTIGMSNSFGKKKFISSKIKLPCTIFIKIW